MDVRLVYVALHYLMTYSICKFPKGHLGKRFCGSYQHIKCTTLDFANCVTYKCGIGSNVCVQNGIEYITMTRPLIYVGYISVESYRARVEYPPISMYPPPQPRRTHTPSPPTLPPLGQNLTYKYTVSPIQLKFLSCRP